MGHCHRCYSEILDSNSLHCKDCAVELETGYECDVCVENSKPKKTGLKFFIEPFFERQVKEMIEGIDVTLKNKNFHLCALALCTYTEVLGGVVTGKLKQQGNSKSNFEAFLPYLGEKYVTLNDEIKKKETSIYKEVRSKLVHEFNPRPSYGMWIQEKPNDEQIGIEFLGDHINFHLKEYCRDFKNAIEEYRQKVETDEDLFEKFMDAGVSIHRSNEDRFLKKS